MHTGKNGAQSYRRGVQVVGLLEGLHLEDESFTLLLDSGQKVKCCLLVGSVRSLSPFFGKRVIVAGTAVWDISGRFHRIDAEGVRSAENAPRALFVLPGPFGESELPPEVRSFTHAQLLASLPPWDGDETDEELLAALKRMG